MQRAIIFVGNSHVNTLRGCYNAVTVDESNSDENYFITTNWLRFPWHFFRFNSHLSRFWYKKNFAPYLDLRGIKAQKNLILVGLGLLGTGITAPYGHINTVPKGEGHNAHLYTPRLPLLDGVTYEPIPKHTAPMITEAEAAKNCREYFGRFLSYLEKLRKRGDFETIHWIPEPDMKLTAAISRFGQDFVESGLYARYREISYGVFEEMITQRDLKEHFILLDDRNNHFSGFVDDTFQGSIDPFDVHVHPHYYQQSVLTLCSELGIKTKQDAEAAE